MILKLRETLLALGYSEDELPAADSKGWQPVKRCPLPAATHSNYSFKVNFSGINSKTGAPLANNWTCFGCRKNGDTYRLIQEVLTNCLYLSDAINWLEANV
jgi:hypothetical protein